MKNKLGVDDFLLEIIEKKIVQSKIDILDERITFNLAKLDFTYLKKLHEFLFNELYYGSDLGTRKLNEEEEIIINKCLEKITNICVTNPNKIDEVFTLLYSIWLLQPFIVGNTRTLIAYLKVINSCFSLNLNVDSNINIESNSKIFRKDFFVN